MVKKWFAWVLKLIHLAAKVLRLAESTSAVQIKDITAAFILFAVNHDVNDTTQVYIFIESFEGIRRGADGGKILLQL